MIEKRKRAQRSRLGESITVLKKVSQQGGAGGATTGSEGYGPSSALAMRIFCG